jgi:hypothetical protein
MYRASPPVRKPVYMYSETGLIIRLRKDIVGSTPTRPTKPGLGLRDFALSGDASRTAQTTAEKFHTGF